MTEPKFTPGPWKYGRKDFLNWDDDLPTIVELPLDYNPRHYSEGAFIYGANGDEIVGCDEYHVFNKPDDIALMLDAWQLPELRREIAELKAINKEMYEALKCACDQYCIGYAGDSIVKCEDCIIGNALRKAKGEKNDRA